MTKFIFGCMNIGNEKDSTISLIEYIESSLLIICEDSKKLKSFIESLSIKTNAEIVQWEYDVVNNQIPKFLIEKNKIIKEIT
jgi:16S rRNA C1402 (ribose-2'-O) methylase RsmI